MAPKKILFDVMSTLQDTSLRSSPAEEYSEAEWLRITRDESQ